MTNWVPVFTINHLLLCVYRYFGGCPLVNIPGMTHPVKVYNLDHLPQLMGRFLQPTLRPTHGGSLDEADVDVDLTVSVIVWVSQIFAQGDGAILCFLPVSSRTLLRISLWIYLFIVIVLTFVWVETRSYCKTHVRDENFESRLYLLRQLSYFVWTLWTFQGWDTISVIRERLLKVRVSRFMMIVPLHSQLPAGEQRAAFARAPSGMRKVRMFALLLCNYPHPTRVHSVFFPRAEFNKFLRPLFHANWNSTLLYCNIHVLSFIVCGELVLCVRVLTRSGIKLCRLF